jgi:hypothetical protein
VITEELLGEAGNSRGAARAARTITTRHGLRMTLIAPRNGHQLTQHAAQAQRLCGWSRAECFRATNRAWRLAADDILAGPPQPHSLLAETDAVVLLTVPLDQRLLGMPGLCLPGRGTVATNAALEKQV